jgi:hypothetical protein
MTLKDGKITDGTAFCDSTAFNELWDTVTPSATTASCYFRSGGHSATRGSAPLWY